MRILKAIALILVGVAIGTIIALRIDMTPPPIVVEIPAPVVEEEELRPATIGDMACRNVGVRPYEHYDWGYIMLDFREDSRQWCKKVVAQEDGKYLDSDGAEINVERYDGYRIEKLDNWHK